MPFYHFFFGGRFPTKIDYRKKLVPVVPLFYPLKSEDRELVTWWLTIRERLATCLTPGPSDSPRLEGRSTPWHRLSPAPRPKRGRARARQARSERVKGVPKLCQALIYFILFFSWGGGTLQFFFFFFFFFGGGGSFFCSS